MENSHLNPGYIEMSMEEFRDGLSWFSEQLPKIGGKFIDYSNTCFKGGELSERHKHLIAVGISIHAQDEYCIIYHCHNALRLGASTGEILETVGVCAAFGGGAALSQGVTLVRKVIQEFKADNTEH